MSSENRVEERLSAVEDRLNRLEDLLVGISQKLDQKPQPAAINEEKGEAFKGWVTDYVSMRLQQLVPETCDHPSEAKAQEGPFLGNTSIRCTEEVVHRVKRIPIHLFERWLSSASLTMPDVRMWMWLRLTSLKKQQLFDNAKQRRSFLCHTSTGRIF